MNIGNGSNSEKTPNSINATKSLSAIHEHAINNKQSGFKNKLIKNIDNFIMSKHDQANFSKMCDYAQSSSFQ